jgi:hypothetical protein
MAIREERCPFAEGPNVLNFGLAPVQSVEYFWGGGEFICIRDVSSIYIEAAAGIPQIGFSQAAVASVQSLGFTPPFSLKAVTINTP